MQTYDRKYMLRITDEMYSDIEEEAKLRGEKVSETVRQLINERIRELQHFRNRSNTG